MDNEKVKAIFWKGYNCFWNKWKDEALPRESPKWDEVIQDANDIMAEYDCRMCRQVILPLLTELEERSWENRGDNVKAHEVSKESGISLEKKLEAVKDLRIADLLHVIREFEDTPSKYEPEVIRQAGLQLMDREISMML